MNNMLTQIDDDALDQVAGGGDGITVGGEIGLDPIGQLFTAIGDTLSSLPQLGWELTIGLVPGSKGR
ncbi:MAG: hypothetical protein ABW352_05860 [Polyangiales bacterium]